MYNGGGKPHRGRCRKQGSLLNLTKHKSSMKKLIFACVLAVASLGVANAQSAIGARFGSGIEFSYLHGLNSGNRVSIDAGFTMFWGFESAATHDWMFTNNGSAVPWAFIGTDTSISAWPVAWVWNTTSGSRSNCRSTGGLYSARDLEIIMATSIQAVSGLAVSPLACAIY